ncbi:hypothetical protein F511_11510 [Dorcoceras hygrometricum]|uniref:Uncharacterized protein n=1 Tax=Dorcoceras hygrometricum TaxID=472368 RepID=A0A2Z7ABP1_9LAMI|nr:hypothetical protein F511_11510 [Dorcoceras hygrometricum]
MANDTEEVFDFSNSEFTRDDLVTTLIDMVKEYKKLSQSFEEVKDEKESCANKAELVSSSEMQAALSKLATDNDELRNRSGLGNGSSDGNAAEKSCTPQLHRTKLQTMNFVRSSTGQPVEVKYDEVLRSRIGDDGNTELSLSPLFVRRPRVSGVFLRSFKTPTELSPLSNRYLFLYNLNLQSFPFRSTVGYLSVTWFARP